MNDNLLEQAAFQRFLIRAFLAPLLALTLLALLLGWQVQHLLAAYERHEHLDTIIEHTQLPLKLLVDMETGQRGYLVSRLPRFLAPYNSAAVSFPVEIDALQRLVTQDPQQTRRLQEIRARYAQWARNAQLEILLRARKKDYRSAFDSAKGKTLMDGLRSQFSTFLSVEEASRQQSIQAERQTARNFLVTTLGLALSVGGLLAWTSVRRLRLLSQSYRHALDISSQQSAQMQQQTEVLKASEARFRFLFDNNPLPMWAYDLETLAFLEVNEAAIEKYGYSRDEFLTMHLMDLRPIEDVPRLLADTRSARPVLQHSGDWHHRLKDGQIIDVEITSHSVNFGGRPAALVVAQDITERKRHELENEHLNVQLRRAMTETHHRVKNNLQVISALIDLQIMSEQPLIPVEELFRINRHVRSLAAMHELLTHEAKTKGNVTEMSSRVVFGKLMPMLRDSVGNRSLRANLQEINLSPKQATALAILVNELVSNAVKHGQGELEVVLKAEGQEACLSVADRGTGFPIGFTATQAANTGLELIESVSRWDLQGDILYANRPDGGAIVTVTFPLSVEVMTEVMAEVLADESLDSQEART